MKKMSFIDHLEELRIRTIKSFLFIILFSISGYYYSDRIIDFLIKPIIHNNINLQVLKITSIFLVKIGISIICGIILSFPFIIYQILKFILPAFENQLNNFKITLITVLCIILFIIGAIFGYNILIPLSISFFKGLSLNLESILLNYTLENYLVYLIWIIIISSSIFQLPILIIFMIKIGIITTDLLIRRRKHIIVSIFVISALLSPPDPISQILIVIPLYLLFEISILISRFIK